MIDIDYFKQYNDTYGHLQGDECLRRVASALNLVVSKGRLFRYGGEEFLCVVPEFGEKQARKLGEEFCRSIERLGIPAADPREYGYHNVGFHMGSEAVTVDFDGVLTKEQLFEIEQQANDAVLRNVPITASLPENARKSRFPSLQGILCRFGQTNLRPAAYTETEILHTLSDSRYKNHRFPHICIRFRRPAEPKAHSPFHPCSEHRTIPLCIPSKNYPFKSNFHSFLPILIQL